MARICVNQLAGLGEHGSVKANTAEETEALDVCLRAHQATPLRSEGVEWEETFVNSTPSVSCSPSVVPGTGPLVAGLMALR